MWLSRDDGTDVPIILHHWLNCLRQIGDTGQQHLEGHRFHTPVQQVGMGSHIERYQQDQEWLQRRCLFMPSPASFSDFIADLNCIIVHWILPLLFHCFFHLVPQHRKPFQKMEQLLICGMNSLPFGNTLCGLANGLWGDPLGHLCYRFVCKGTLQIT